jgi:hypothetical protein
MAIGLLTSHRVTILSAPSHEAKRSTSTKYKELEIHHQALLLSVEDCLTDTLS